MGVSLLVNPVGQVNFIQQEVILHFNLHVNMVLRNFVKDRDELKGSCKAFTKYYEPVLVELQNVRPNYKVRHNWLWNNCLNYHGDWVGHAYII